MRPPSGGPAGAFASAFVAAAFRGWRLFPAPPSIPTSDTSYSVHPANNLTAKYHRALRVHQTAMPLSITQATPADLDSLLPMMRHMQKEDPWVEHFHEPTLRSNLSELFHNSVSGVVYIVRQESAPIGYLVICFDYSLEYRGKGAWIDELFVEPAHRGKGIGSQLLDLAEAASREHRAKFLHLEVNHGNPALELYRRRGFVDHQRYLMSKPLGN